MRFIVGVALVLGVSVSAAYAESSRSNTVRQASFSQSIAKASKSVVSLYASKNVARLEDNVEAAIYGNVMADEFNQHTKAQVKLKEERSLGSGVIVKSDGLIITNSHLVSDAQDIKVITSNNNTYEAAVVAVDKSLDLAILQLANVKGQKFEVIDFADSDSVLVGDVVFALGNPFGIGQSASMGIVSAIGRSNFNLDTAQYLIQTDAAINPGNSGGALIDVDGKLVGLNSAIFSKTEAFSGVGFSVPSNAVKFVLDTLEMNGSIQRAWLGAKGEDISQNIKNRLGLSSTKGVYINQVVNKSPADIAGVKAGDVLIKLHHSEVTDSKTLNALTINLPINKKISAKVIRHGRVLELEAILKPIEKRSESDKFMIRGNNFLAGVVVEKLSPELNYILNLSLDSKGLAIIDRPARVGNSNIQVGDVILQINKTPIIDMASLKSVLNKPAPFGLKLTVLRSGKRLKLFIK